MRETILEVDVKEFKSNIEKIKNFANEKILMPVVKANAYGTYLNYKSEIMNDFEIVCVATVDEAIYMRRTGYKNDILVLNQPCVGDIENIIRFKVTVGLCDRTFLKELMKCEKTVQVHLELETGMNRTGIKEEELEEFVSIIKTAPNLVVSGVYTHFSSADSDEEYTQRQREVFERGVQKIKEQFDTIKYIHSSASTGILHVNDNISNSIRPGLLIYGYYPNEKEKELIDVKPICKLRAKISHIFTIDEGESVSYGRHFISDRKMKIATIQIGYADGLRRDLSNRGEVVIHGQKVPIIGNVCMDSCMVDITEISKNEDINVGEDVYIWDNNVITLEDVADKCNTINYEILSTVSSRVARKFENM